MRRWLTVAIVGTISFAPVAVRAQATTAARTQTALATPTVEDMALLKKAIDAVQKNPVLIRSDIRMKATSNGMVLIANESIKVIGQFPGKFSSEVVVWDEDGKTPAAKFQIIGDGENVFTYQPAVKQYGVQTVPVFQKDFATPAIGIVCGLLASGQQWSGDEPPANEAAVASFLEMLKQGAGLVLESGPGKNGQRIYEMRTVAADAKGFRIRLTADPLSQSFVQVEMQGMRDTWKISITETIRSQAKLGSLETSTVFTPPADAVKVDKLTVWSF